MLLRYRQVLRDIRWQVERARVDLRCPVTCRTQYPSLPGAVANGFDRRCRQRGVLRRPPQGHKPTYVRWNGSHIGRNVREELSAPQTRLPQLVGLHEWYAALIYDQTARSQ